jgi:hypothetical protein
MHNDRVGLVHENDGQRQMETRLASDVAQLTRNRRYFVEKHFDEREKSSFRHVPENRLSLARQNWVLRLEEQGIEPLLLGRTRTPQLHVRPSVTLLFNR